MKKGKGTAYAARSGKSKLKLGKWKGKGGIASKKDSGLLGGSGGQGGADFSICWGGNKSDYTRLLRDVKNDDKPYGRKRTLSSSVRILGGSKHLTLT